MTVIQNVGDLKLVQKENDSDSFEVARFAGVPCKDRELASDIGKRAITHLCSLSASMRQGRWLAGPLVQKTGHGRPVSR